MIVLVVGFIAAIVMVALVVSPLSTIAIMGPIVAALTWKTFKIENREERNMILKVALPALGVALVFGFLVLYVFHVNMP